MIKFFRRIRQRLLTENKFSKYLLYAIGEIVLVVIGILIALQINNWNEERKRENAEAVILEQVKTDLKKSQTGLEAIKDFYLQRARISAQVTRAFYKADLPDNITEYLSGALSRRGYSPVLGTARSLINSGKIDIISSAELKNDIISYVERVDYLLKEVNRFEETYFRTGIDLIFQAKPNNRDQETVEALNNNYELNKETIDATLTYRLNMNEREFPLAKNPFKTGLKELFQDVRFYSGYRKLLTSHRNTYYRYNNIHYSTNKLLDKLNSATNDTRATPATAKHNLEFDSLDLKILQKADALLTDSSKWNKQDERSCDDDIFNEKYSLYCALYKASIEIAGEYEHRRPAMELARFILEKYEYGRIINHRLMDWNNHPDTTFEEVKLVLKESIEEIDTQLTIEDINKSS